MTQDNIKPDSRSAVKSSDMNGEHKYTQLPNETDRQFLARINDPTKWLYGSEVRDDMLLRSAHTLPRFSHLSRKAFTHYLGSRYNPHTIEIIEEIQLRTLIQWLIEYKIQGRVKGYDWELVDENLKVFIYNLMNIPLPEDFKPLDREILPEFRSPYHGLELQLPN